MPHNLDFAAEHARVLAEANKVFVTKSRVRGQMWLEFPPSDKIRELRERVTRIERCYSKREEALAGENGSTNVGSLDDVIVEDAIDLINYTNFLIKQIRRGMRG